MLLRFSLDADDARAAARGERDLALVETVSWWAGEHPGRCVVQVEVDGFNPVELVLVPSGSAPLGCFDGLAP